MGGVHRRGQVPRRGHHVRAVRGLPLRAGDADTSRLMRLVETASEVVETIPRPSRSMSNAFCEHHRRGRCGPSGRAGAARVRERHAGAEHRVGGGVFQRGGAALQRRRRRGWPALPGGPRRWQALPAGVFYTGSCAPAGTGSRCAPRTRPARPRAVRLAGGADARAVRAGRRRAGAAGTRRTWTRPGKPMRWDWQIGRVTPLQRTGAHAVDIYDIDGFLTTAAQVHAMHTRWQAATLAHPKAVCYLDLAWEDYRPDGTPGRLPGRGARQRLLRLSRRSGGWTSASSTRSSRCWTSGSRCARQGLRRGRAGRHRQLRPAVDHGVPPDPGDAQNLLAYAFNETHRLRHDRAVEELAVADLVGPPLHGRRGGRGVLHLPGLLRLPAARQQAVRHHLHGAGRETPCGWDAFSADRTAAQPTGKWVGEAEYGADHYVCTPGQPCPAKRRFATFCRRVYAPPYGFSAVKLDVDLDGKMFYPSLPPRDVTAARSGFRSARNAVRPWAPAVAVAPHSPVPGHRTYGSHRRHGACLITKTISGSATATACAGPLGDDPASPRAPGRPAVTRARPPGPGAGACPAPGCERGAGARGGELRPRSGRRLQRAIGLKAAA